MLTLALYIGCAAPLVAFLSTFALPKGRTVKAP